MTVTGLSVLDLSDTIQSERIPRDLLATIGKSTIQYVRFGDVSWRQLRNGDIPPMPSLRTFEIRNSLLQEIEPETLSPLTNLENLNLQGNLLSTIPLNMLEPLPQLQRLDLSGYDSGAGKEPGLVPLFVRFRLQRKTFVYGTNLRSLRLDHKRMVRLQRSALIGLFKLEDLSMRYCDLRHVEYLTFFSLKSIVRLDLSGNPALIRLLRSDQEDTFVGLEALQQLTMNDCELEDEDLNSSDGSAADTNPAGWLKRVYEQLKVLHLAGNRLTELTQETLASFEQLRELDLSRNRLISWHNRTLFSRNAFVQRLDVSGNRLHSITPEMLADFRKMRWLSFARNPLHCECGWQAPLLLWNEPVTAKNSGHQPPATLNQAQHAVIQQHLKRLVDRQQQIVSAVFSSAPNQAPPNSVLDWLRTTNLIFERGGHPLQSSAYYCVTEDQNEQKNVPPKSIHSTIDLIRLPSTNTSSSNGTFEKVQTDAEIEQQLLTLIRCRHLGRWANCDDSLDHFESMGQFFEIGNCSASGRRNAYHVGFSFALIGALAFSIMLLSAFCLLVAFVYHASLRSLISKVEQDLLHSYDYDAFVSYSVNDSEWVFNQLVPGLEEWPTQFNQPMLDAPNSMLAGPSPNAATGPTASSDTIPNTWYKRLCKVGFIKNQVWLQSKNMFGGKNSLGESKATATANVTDNESDSTCSIDMKTCRSSRSNSTSSGSSYMSTASQLESADGGPVDPNQCAGQSKATPGEWNANIDPTELKQIRLCVYDRDFIAGRPIAECIAESIRSSRKVILVISNNFIASPWCRFETDLAHNTMLDQNRDGLILIRLEEKLDTTMLEKVAPQLHFLLKTRIYLQWSADPRQQEIFWRKLYSALGFPRPGHLSAYNRMRHYYQHYWPIATQTSGTSGQSSGTNCASSAVSNKLSKTDIKRRHSVVLAPTKGNMGMPLILHHHSSQTDENNNRVKGRLASISCNGKLQNSPDPKFEGTGKGEAAARSMSGPVSLQLTADKPDSEPENNQKPVYETLSSCGDNSLNCNLQPLVLQQLFQESKFRVNEIDRTQRKMDTSSTITGDRVSRSGPSNTSNEIQLIPLNRSQTYFGQSIYGKFIFFLNFFYLKAIHLNS